MNELVNEDNAISMCQSHLKCSQDGLIEPDLTQFLRYKSTRIENRESRFHVVYQVNKTQELGQKNREQRAIYFDLSSGVNNIDLLQSFERECTNFTDLCFCIKRKCIRIY